MPYISTNINVNVKTNANANVNINMRQFVKVGCVACEKTILLMLYSEISISEYRNSLVEWKNFEFFMLKQLVKEIYLEIMIVNNHFFHIQEIRFFPLSTLPDYHNKVPLILQLWKILLFNVEAKCCLRGWATNLILVTQKVVIQNFKRFYSKNVYSYLCPAVWALFFSFYITLFL